MTDLFTPDKPPPPPKPLAKIGPGARLRTCWDCDRETKAACKKCGGTRKVRESDELLADQMRDEGGI